MNMKYFQEHKIEEHATAAKFKCEDHERIKKSKKKAEGSVEKMFNFEGFLKWRLFHFVLKMCDLETKNKN